MVTRRDFLRKAGIAATATAFLPALDMCTAVKKTGKTAVKETGLILYTVRNEMTKDPDGTLKAVADMGYNWIEAADYSNGLFYKIKPAEFRKKVEGLGMKFLSSHNGINASNADKMIADASEAGLKYLVLPSLPGQWGKSLDGYKQAADFFNVAGEKCKKAGIRFGFHNHWAEFNKIDNQIPYDILLKNSDPNLVYFEIDLAWIIKGGQNPVEYFKKYPGRFEVWHIKDLSSSKEDATLGEGTIDFKPLFAEAKQAGMKYWFIEQDSCKTHTPLESAKISRQFLIDKIL
jgi:sugar phosphate isomerase/epimerase